MTAADSPRQLYQRAFHRPPLLDAASLRAATPIIGNVERLRRKLSGGEPVTIAAIGSSNVAFEAIEATWPNNRGHRLVNRALMATGPSGFHGCLNRFIPHEADVAIIGFADVCNQASLPLHNTTFGLQLEELVRELASRADPPAILFFNYFKFISWSCTLEHGLCSFWMGCEAQMQELAQFYSASAISMRNAMYHQGAIQFGGEGPRRSARDFHRWTSDNGGHFDLGLGDNAGTPTDSMQPRGAAPFYTPARPWSMGGTGVSGAPMSCYSFDDSFGGALSAPQVVAARNWTLVTTERSPHSGERKVKPGYRASRRGATLRLSTRAVGEQQFTIGYLSSQRSQAVATVTCVEACHCAPLTLRTGVQKAASGDTTATTEFTPTHVARAPEDSPCMLEVSLESDGEAFKVIALHVRSALT